MHLRSLVALFFSLFAGETLAACDSFPWKFGMSQAEVSDISECGPYKTFSNGDLETYNGVFDGKKENFQFFFQDGKLRRIGIYLHESQDPAAGAREWLILYGKLSRLFGEIETPENIAPSGASGEEAFVAKALEAVQGPGKVQMAPFSQPKDAAVFSSFLRREVSGENHYYVVLYFDRRP